MSDQEQKKSDFEKIWAEMFLEYYNSEYGFDYSARPKLNVPAIDVIGVSNSGVFPAVKLELTEAKQVERVIKYGKDKVIFFNINYISEALTKKEEKYRDKDVDIRDVILLVQGHLPKDWMEDIINSLKQTHKNSLFRGIYYICPESVREPSFVMEIKGCSEAMVDSNLQK